MPYPKPHMEHAYRRAPELGEPPLFAAEIADQSDLVLDFTDIPYNTAWDALRVAKWGVVAHCRNAAAGIADLEEYEPDGLIAIVRKGDTRSADAHPVLEIVTRAQELAIPVVLMGNRNNVGRFVRPDNNDVFIPFNTQTANRIFGGVLGWATSITERQLRRSYQSSRSA